MIINYNKQFALKNFLIDKIKKKNIRIGIIGLGYVGLPLAINFCKKNLNVIGFDTDDFKIKKLNKGQSYIERIKNKEIVDIKKNFHATRNFSSIRLCDVIVICVPTPLTKNKKPDLSYLKSAIKKIYPYLKKGQLLSVESTTYPGTTKEIVLPIIKKKFEVGKNFFISYSPEREDPGNKYFKTKNVPKIISGLTENCLRISILFYKNVFKKLVPVSSTDAAEFTKLLENIYRSVNIGLVNEMKIIAHKMNLDIHEIIKAAATKPFGYRPFTPGPGLGGHCIPIDPFYMSWKSKKLGYNPKFIMQSGKINSYMPIWTVNKIKKSFSKNKIDLKKSKILIVGIAYKKNVDDLRESPALEVIEILRKQQAKIAYYDPYVPKLYKNKKNNYSLKSIKLNKNSLIKYDAVVIITDHDNINYEVIKKNSKLLFDCRGRLNVPNSNIKSNVISL